jgi:magnesium transporter
MAFEITDEFLNHLSELISSNNDDAITSLFEEVHFADIADY